MAATGSFKAYVTDGGSKAVRCSSSCKFKFILSNFSFESESDTIEVVVWWNDFFYGLSIPDDVEAAGGERLALPGRIVEAEGESVAESPLVLSDGAAEAESH